MALVVTATGWTHEQVREMSLGDVMALLSYWRDFPPVHVIMAARYLKPKKPHAEAFQPRDMRELGSMLGAPKPMKPYMTELLDWAENQNRV